MTCDKSIIECLRDLNVQPLAFVNHQDSTNIASNSIDYSASNYFWSSWDGWSNNYEHWLCIDFKQNVLIEKYQIKGSTKCDNIYSWTAYASNDNITYEVIDYISNEHPNGKNYTLGAPKTMRYFKIIGMNTSCLCFFY